MMISISSKIVKARKVHSCDLCLCKIEIGEKYRSQFNKVDIVYSFKNHIHCEEIAGKLKLFDECEEGLTEEIFQECIREEFIKLMEHHQSEVFNYQFYEYPIFYHQLNYVLEMHKIESK